MSNLIKTTLTPSTHGTGEHSQREHSALQDANRGTPVTIKHQAVSQEKSEFSLQTEKVQYINIIVSIL